LPVRKNGLLGHVVVELMLWAPPDKFDANEAGFEQNARNFCFALAPDRESAGCAQTEG
jgi:hypothetical protein